MGQFRELFRAYKVAHKYREEWYNIKWRLLVILLSVIFIFFVYWYLFFYQPYFYWLPEFEFLLSEQLFKWFMIGSIFGIVSVGLIFEGEFLLGLRHISKELAAAEKDLGLKAEPKAERKSPRKGRK